MLFLQLTFAQFSPTPGNLGSDAIHKDSSCFVGWATGASVYRGWLDINHKDTLINNTSYVSFGSVYEALGKAEGNSFNCVSIGDSGVAILFFESTLYNGPGPDFAVFENSFGDNYIELAFVEVSSDGEHYYRFPAVSNFPVIQQVGPFSYADASQVNQLAGKYRQGYGVPFDLEVLKDSLDVMHISYIKLIDVIGSVSKIHSIDSKGDTINDPYPTPFESGGFDLDAIGVMYLNSFSAKLNSLDDLNLQIYPNPAEHQLTIQFDGQHEKRIYIMDLTGRILQNEQINRSSKIDISNLSSGSYIIEVDGVKQQFIKN